MNLRNSEIPRKFSDICLIVVISVRHLVVMEQSPRVTSRFFAVVRLEFPRDSKIILGGGGGFFKKSFKNFFNFRRGGGRCMNVNSLGECWYGVKVWPKGIQFSIVSFRRNQWWPLVEWLLPRGKLKNWGKKPCPDFSVLGSSMSCLICIVFLFGLKWRLHSRCYGNTVAVISVYCSQKVWEGAHCSGVVQQKIAWGDSWLGRDVLFDDTVSCWDYVVSVLDE